MNFNKLSILGSLTALIFSHNLTAQEFDLTTDYVNQHIENSIVSMLADLSSIHVSHEVANQVVYQLNRDFAPAESSADFAASEEGGFTPTISVTD